MADEYPMWQTVLIIIGAVLVVGAVSWVIEWRTQVGTWDVPVLQFVSGTEYNVGEFGQVITEARYLNGSSALQACNFTIWYPDKLPFVVVVGVSSVSGNQYMNFTVPNLTGVYEYQAQCLYDNGKFGVVSKSFHVSEFQNDTSTKLNRVKAVIEG